jgi:predicted dinucleotide-binding enzyme
MRSEEEETMRIAVLGTGMVGRALVGRFARLAYGVVIGNPGRGAGALEAVGAANLAGKVLVDLALPLDFSDGMPPKLLFANTDSLGERIQRAFSDARVVKTLNTVFKDVMIDPTRVPGCHNVFVAGDDMVAKDTVRDLLKDFGWPEEAVIDVGGIEAARGHATSGARAETPGSFERRNTEEPAGGESAGPSVRRSRVQPPRPSSWANA